MLFQAVVTSALLLLSLPVSIATPLDSVDEFYSMLYTTAYCQAGGDLGSVAGVMISPTTGRPFCDCVDVPGLDGGLNSDAVCGGGSLTSACLHTGLSSDTGGTWTYNTTCTSCEDTKSCENYVYTDLEFDSACSAGQVLFLGGLGAGSFCGCDTPADLALPDATESVVCPTPEHSYAVCYSSETDDGLSMDNSDIVVASCSFTCLPGYQASTDGESCVLSPSGISLAKRREMKETISRAQREMIF